MLKKEQTSIIGMTQHVLTRTTKGISFFQDLLSELEELGVSAVTLQFTIEVLNIVINVL